MDTRQLAAFCAVVERHSFSQAAERLGVTQPAVSLQVRALEKRLGTQLLDRSGRRVEPTEAGLTAVPRRPASPRARGAGPRRRRLGGRGRPHRRALDRRLDGTGGRRRAAAPLRVPARASRGAGGARGTRHPHGRRPRRREAARARDRRRITARTVACSSSPSRTTRSSSSARRGTGSPAGRSRSHELADETLVVMQEGAGVRRIVDDELRRLGLRLRDLDVRLELGLQESVRSAVWPASASRSSPGPPSRRSSRRACSPRPGSRGWTGRARSSSRGAPRASRRAPRRNSRSSRASGSRSSASGSRRRRAGPPRERMSDPPVRITRFGAGSLTELADLCDEIDVKRPMLVATRRGAAAVGERPVVGVYDGVRPHVPVETVHEAAARAQELGADGLVGLGGGSATDTCKAVVAELASASQERLPRVVAVPTTYAGAEWTPYFGMLLGPGKKGGGSDRRAMPIAAIYDPELTLDLPHRGDRRHRDERARALRRGLLPPGCAATRAPPRGHGGDGDRPRAPARGREPARDLRPHATPRRRDARRVRARGLGRLPRPRDGPGARRPVRASAGRHERRLPARRAPVQPGGGPGGRRPPGGGARDGRRARARR